MSLTSCLDDRGSMVSRFMTAELPGVRDMQASYRATLPAGGEVLRPDPPGGTRPTWGTLGHAIEHRLRYAFADVAEPSPAVRHGVAAAAGRSDRGTAMAVSRAATDVLRALAALVAQERPASRDRDLMLAKGGEDLLERICYAMGWFEEVYRTGRLWPGTPLGDARPSLTAHTLLAAVPGYAIADLGAQVRLASRNLAGLRAASRADQVRPWPMFAGSADAGGADADLIVGDLLLEIKSRAAATLRREDVYQILGYMLLDYPDEYQIGRVGWYLTRHGHLVIWTVSECLGMLGARRPLAELRDMLSRSSVNGVFMRSGAARAASTRRRFPAMVR